MECGYYTPIVKKGFTSTDKIHLGITITLLIIYIILISLFPYDTYLNNTINNIQDNKITAYNISNNVIGFLLGLSLSLFITRVILREFEPNVYILVVCLIISIVLIICYYVSIFNPDNTTGWIKYRYALIPLIGVLMFMCQYSITKILLDPKKIKDIFTNPSNDSSDSSSSDSYYNYNQLYKK
jgi:magnesium-transporting ATPase (P-type)